MYCQLKTRQAVLTNKQWVLHVLVESDKGQIFTPDKKMRA